MVSTLRPKRCLLAINRKLRDAVASKLILEWSPEQISVAQDRVSQRRADARVHETIYRSLFIQARGVLKQELLGTFDRSAAYAVAALSYLQRLARSNRRCDLD